MRRTAGYLLAIALAGCAASPAPVPQPAALAAPCGGGKPTFASGGERATLWFRHSTEFRAASEIIYRAAEAALRAGLADPAWSAEPTQAGDLSALPPAVVMDIDETVLDNSAQQAQMTLDGTCFEDFDKAWDAWLATRSAAAIPGAAAFIRAAREMKDPRGRPVRIVFVTNRECVARLGNASACPQQDDTAANLRSLGLDAPTLEQDLMLKGGRPEWTGEKQTRRLAIAATHRILLYVGDDFGDFLPDVKRQTVPEREQARCQHHDRWGRQWFMIPNPMYGSWLVALGPDLEGALASPQVIENCDAP